VEHNGVGRIAPEPRQARLSVGGGHDLEPGIPETDTCRLANRWVVFDEEDPGLHIVSIVHRIAGEWLRARVARLRLSEVVPSRPMTRAAVLFGGPSDEHDISILTGLQVAHALDDPAALYWSKAGE